MIDGLTVAGLSDTGAQLKRHCNLSARQRKNLRWFYRGAADRGEYRQAAEVATPNEILHPLLPQF
jgi:hypothetical protein